ncbi:hypothetical protein QFZ81_001028 [Paenibacillus sp. V4I9]|uniref:hypothetical protein n=1 Tax=Paenibacillus sp. V4I9 TaxID=3042308 RepID=UPI002780D276|nr:hypothetical protein [Paenibacillus sp. V4I9]MDQ0885940.1 hypothetical protein [Paenibacillus sp. V4I9]
MSNIQTNNKVINVDEESIKLQEIVKLNGFQKLYPFFFIFFALLAMFLWYLWMEPLSDLGWWIFYIFNIEFVVSSGWYGTIACLISVFFAVKSSNPVGRAQRRIQSEKEQRITSILDSVEGFDYSHKYVEQNYNVVLALDESRNKLCIIDTSVRVFSANEILEVEAIEDDVQVMKTSRGSQAAGAIVGGVLLGGVGAIIGGLSGQRTTSSDKVKRVYIKLVVNDMERPFVTIDFLNDKLELSKTNVKAVKAIQDVNHWHSLISVLIKRGDEKVNQSSRKESFNGSAADELLKFSKLVELGLMTKEEFEKQKVKLL